MKRTIKIILSLSLGLIALISLSSCKVSQSYESPYKIIGKWQIAAIEGEAINLPTPVSLNFDLRQMRLGGYAVCNSFGGSFSLNKEGAFAMGDIISTRVGCDNIGFESELYALLKKASFLCVSGDKAYLYANKEDAQPLIELKR